MNLRAALHSRRFIPSWQRPVGADFPAAGGAPAADVGRFQGPSSRRPAPQPEPRTGGAGPAAGRPGEKASILIIVLWIALGLVTVALYFANAMTFELRASDNRVSGLAADQAIEGAVRYVTAVLAAQTNGNVPDLTSYQSQAVPVGEAHFWLIGRPVTYQVQPDEVFFGLVDEASKLNLNVVSTEMLMGLTNMTEELAANIVDWRNTNLTTSANGDGDTVYTTFQPAYFCKHAPFDTVEELRLVYPLSASDLSALYGEDSNLNGVLDPNEADTNRNSVADLGLLEYCTVYTREPNTQADGSPRVSLNPVDTDALRQLMLTNGIATDRVTAIINALGQTNTSQLSFTSPLAFYMQSSMTADEYALIANSVTVTNGDYIVGRVNLNTAPTAVLAALPGLTGGLDQVLATYRQQNPDRLTSIAWVAEALGQSYTSALTELRAGDYITTQSYQFTADVAAVGPYGRGYRRVKLVFDTSSGTPQVIYRRDLSHLGWALGRYVRHDWITAKDTP